jgi:hypothetical protein
MEADAVTPPYELLHDARVAANRREVALRLKEAGFEGNFASGLFPSRADSSIKSSAAPTVKTSARRRREDDVESDFKPRRSSRTRLACSYSEGAEEVAPTRGGKTWVSPPALNLLPLT